MQRSGWLVSAMIMAAMCGIANAADPADADVQARLKALEKRVQELEQRLSAAPVAAQPAAPAATAAPVSATSAAVAVAPPPPATGKWKDASAWGKLERGMGWSQVKALLGPAGATTTGMFGDVWFYPDSSGGRVVFDRDSRVATWIEPPVR